MAAFVGNIHAVNIRDDRNGVEFAFAFGNRLSHNDDFGGQLEFGNDAVNRTAAVERAVGRQKAGTRGNRIVLDVGVAHGVHCRVDNRVDNVVIHIENLPKNF